jgi:hypothetical protein
MPITFTCPACTARITAPDKAAGRPSHCPGCGRAVRVPSPARARTPPAPAPPPSDSVGITSLVLGLAALPFAWVPVVGVTGFALGGLACLFGSLGLIVSGRRRGRGVGYALGGVSTGLLALGIAWVVSGQMYLDAAQRVRDAYDRVQQKHDTEQRHQPASAPPAANP